MTKKLEDGLGKLIVVALCCATIWWSYNTITAAADPNRAAPASSAVDSPYSIRTQRLLYERSQRAKELAERTEIQGPIRTEPLVRSRVVELRGAIARVEADPDLAWEDKQALLEAYRQEAALWIGWLETGP